MAKPSACAADHMPLPPDPFRDPDSTRPGGAGRQAGGGGATSGGVTVNISPDSSPSVRISGSPGSPSSSSSTASADFVDAEMARGASFHIPLHRFFAAMVREAASIGTTPKECEAILKALCVPSNNIDDPTALCANAEDSLGLVLLDASERLGGRWWRRLAEHPMRVLAFCAQISSGLWRRNGIAMVNQVVNYSAPPLCIRLRDLDILLLQAVLSRLNVCSNDPDIQGSRFIASAVGGGSEWGGDRADHRCGFLYALAHKFGLYKWMLLACGCSEEAVSRAGALKSERAADDGQRVSMSEELLWLLIVLVTELPRPAGGSSLKEQLRRELVHRLLAQPCTRSELSECADLTNVPKLARGELLEGVLREVADKKAPTNTTSTGSRARTIRAQTGACM